MALARATLQFHAANILKRRQARNTSDARRYRITVARQTVDLWLRPLGGDLFIFQEMLGGQFYRLPSNLLGQAPVIVDLGAHIGLATLFFAERYPGATFVCVEPDPNNAALLRRNVQWLGDRVQVLEGAVTDFSGEGRLLSGTGTWGGRLAGVDSGPQVVCYTLDDIMRTATLDHIDLLKVDIEGEERRLFKGNPPWLSKVNAIVIELHESYQLPDFESDVAPAGFTVAPPGPRHGNRMPIAYRAAGAGGVA
ncbi:MAG: FkbM family methyltransferase [Chloroflexi bacterium]|nr:FkbM family methyltransferase [Chloroflexota bacterium]